MFCMPFQLVEPFAYWTIPGVAIAAFFFLGLLAAGEEIEQPFGAFVLPSVVTSTDIVAGYDENEFVRAARARSVSNALLAV